MLAIDTETTGLFIHKGCRAFTITASSDDCDQFTWKFKVDPFTRKVLYKQDILEDFFETVAKHKELIFHHANFDLQALTALGLDHEVLFKNHTIHDTMVMSHAYNSRQTHGLKALGVTVLDYPEDDEKLLSSITKEAARKAKKLGWCVASKENPHYTIKGTKKSIYRSDYWVPQQYAEEVGLPKDDPYHTICDQYAIGDTDRTLGIFLTMKQWFDDEGHWKSYEKRRDDILPLLRMQLQQVDVDKDALKKAQKDFYMRSCKFLSEVRKLVKNPRFNPASPKQLSDALFKRYKFEPVKMGKSGPSTDKDTMAKLLEDCPPTGELPHRYQFLLAMKKLRKAQTTHRYIQNYLDHTIRGMLQPTIKQTATGTNRLAMENPNTSNVGGKDMSNPFEANERITISIDEKDKQEEAFKLRNVFGPKYGDRWTCIDYQQSQLRIFAVVSESYDLLEAFERGDDIHDTVARKIFNTSDISKQQRTAAKNVNFGILFGAGPAKIEATAGIPGLYSLFTSNFPNAAKFLNKQSNLAKTKGYVHTLGGYRLYVPKERSYAASCYVIQGTEAEMVRNAIQEIDHYTYNATDYEEVTEACPYKMIMMVHDEIVFRSDRHSEQHINHIMGLMEKAGSDLGLPMAVDADIVTQNWAEKYGLKDVCSCGDAIVSWKKHEDTYSGCLSCHNDFIGRPTRRLLDAA